MSHCFRAGTLDHPLLLPPSLQEWLPEGHLARFVVDVTEQLDLSAICARYTRKDGPGASWIPPVAADPVAALGLLRRRRQ